MTAEREDEIRENLRGPCCCHGFEMCLKCETGKNVASELLYEIDVLRSFIRDVALERAKELKMNEKIEVMNAEIQNLKAEMEALKRGIKGLLEHLSAQADSLEVHKKILEKIFMKIEKRETEVH